jgi:magnesium transporter
MIRIHRLLNGNCTTEEQPAIIAPAQAHERTWVEVVQPTQPERAQLVSALGLHEIALEDALRRGEPPKLQDFGDHLFLIAHSAVRDERGGTRKLALFLSRAWVVSVAREPLPIMDEVLQNRRRDPRVGAWQPDLLAWAMLDRLTDGFEELIDQMIDRVGDLEQAALAQTDADVIRSSLKLRREHARLMRIVRSQRDVFSALARTSHPALSRASQPYMHWLADHARRLYEMLDDLRDNVSAARDAYLAVTSNRLAEAMRMMTVIATVTMPLALIAGIFGMNFTRIPGLDSASGFWIVLAAMLALGLGMLVGFHRRRWI